MRRRIYTIIACVLIFTVLCVQAGAVSKNSAIFFRGGKSNKQSSSTVSSKRKTKIKVAKIDKEKEKITDELRSKLEDEQYGAGRLSDIQFQLLSTGIYFAAQRAASLIDFSKSVNLKIYRTIFCLYIILTQFFMRLRNQILYTLKAFNYCFFLCSYIRKLIEKKNDESLLALPNPLSGLNMPGIPAALAKSVV